MDSMMISIKEMTGGFTVGAVMFEFHTFEKGSNIEIFIDFRGVQDIVGWFNARFPREIDNPPMDIKAVASKLEMLTGMFQDTNAKIIWGEYKYIDVLEKLCRITGSSRLQGVAHDFTPVRRFYSSDWINYSSDVLNAVQACEYNIKHLSVVWRRFTSGRL